MGENGAGTAGEGGTRMEARLSNYGGVGGPVLWVNRWTETWAYDKMNNRVGISVSSNTGCNRWRLACKTQMERRRACREKQVGPGDAPSFGKSPRKTLHYDPTHNIGASV